MVGLANGVPPVDASESEIHTAENCITGKNWTQDLGSDIMLDDSHLSVQL
jgi:hypothetical protein